MTQRVTLADVCERIDYGLTASASTEVDGPKFLRITDIDKSFIDWATVPSVDASASDLAKYALHGDDIVVARTGASTGRSQWISNAPESVFASYLVRFTPGPKVHPRFLGYVLQSSSWFHFIEGRAHGKSAQPNLSASAMGEFAFDLPALTAQGAIADVLGALDDKIAANTKLATTSLALVNAEFALRFRNRALATALGDLAKVVDCLHSKKPDRVSDGSQMMQLANIRDDGLVDRSFAYPISRADYANWSRKFETAAWDLVITNVGRVGAVARIPHKYRSAIGRNMTGIRPLDVSESGSFLAAALLSAAVRREIELRTDAGSVMSALNVKSIPLLRLPESSPLERREFHTWAAPLYERADFALEENIALHATRDALLPALMSGRLTVQEAALRVGV